MKALSTFTFSRSTTRESKYDWNKLLDGGIYQLTEGDDYTCKPETMITIARTAAKKRGLTIKAQKVDGGLVIQAIKPEAKPAAATTPKSSKK